MIPMMCVNSMSDDLVVFGSCIFAQQGLSESDLSISIGYVFSMFDEYVDDEAPRGPKIAPT